MSVLLRLFALAVSAVSLEGAVTLPDRAEACVAWAADDLAAALAAPGQDAEAVVSIAPELGAEAFTVAVAGRRVEIAGGDAVGAMYGLFEVAEQVRDRGIAGVAATAQRPFLEVRADNPFVHARPLLIDDVAMWREYIDQLARSRFNLLDLHGAYDLDTTGFPNLYPLLVHVPDYPQAGNQAEQARHLANLRAIVAHARSRGVRVAFMNYAASVDGVRGDRLADYTAKAVATLIREVPDLAELGFRIGETGQPAGFFKDAYLRGIAASGRDDLRICTRSWQTTRDQLEAIGAACRGGFDIEIKYNGEHLGLPYQALHGGFGSYSYEGYLTRPAPYRIVWQVRANGTHRYWAWADTDFIRRTVRSCRLGAARGLSIEPPIAYLGVAAAPYYRSDADRGVYRWIWQKHWMWHLAWGRLAYDPDLPEERLLGGYARRFGAAGADIYRALQDSGWIVPLTLAYRFMGADSRNHSPETETGVEIKGGRSVEAKTILLRKPMLRALAFANAPMDRRSFAGHDDFIDAKLTGRPDGRIGPPAVAARFRAMAAATRADLARIEAPAGRPGDEWRLLRADLLAACALADYEAARIDGSLRAGYGLRAGDRAEFDRGLALLADSRVAWRDLAGIADAVYAPLENHLRDQAHYRWGDALPALADIDTRIADLWRGRPAPAPGAGPLQLTPGDLGADLGMALGGVRRAIAADRVELAIHPTAAAGVAEVRCWWKELPSGAQWRSVPMAAGADGAFTVALPLTAAGVMYQFELRDRDGQARCLPDPFRETPYSTITPQNLEPSR